MDKAATGGQDNDVLSSEMRELAASTAGRAVLKSWKANDVGASWAMYRVIVTLIRHLANLGSPFPRLPVH